MKKSAFAAGIFLFMLFVFNSLDAFCQERDLVRIAYVYPPTKDRLYEGDIIEAEVEIEYKLVNAKIGKVESGTTRYEILAEEVVEEGSGTIAFSVTFKMPSATGLSLQTSFSPKGVSITNVTHDVVYKVIPE